VRYFVASQLDLMCIKLSDLYYYEVNHGSAFSAVLINDF